MSEPGRVERRMRALLDRLASEQDPNETAPLMREYQRLSVLAAGAPPAPPSGDSSSRPAYGDRTSTPEN